MLKAEQGLMGVGNGDGVFVCLRCVVLKQTPVLCLHALAFTLHTKSQDNITEMEQLLQLSVKKKRAPNQKVSHHTLFTQDKLSISNSTEWSVVPCSGVPGKPKTPKKTRGNPTQISNVSLTDSQDALTGNNTCNNGLTITWYLNGGLNPLAPYLMFLLENIIVIRINLYLLTFLYCSNCWGGENGCLNYSFAMKAFRV